jgi:hypothetical protein
MNLTNIVIRNAIFITLVLFTGCVKGFSENSSILLSSESIRGNSNFHSIGNVYYVDANSGNDTNNGLNPAFAWKSLLKVQSVELHAGDVVRFKRGTEYSGQLLIRYSGTKDNYITFSDYGRPQDKAPMFTNPDFAQDNFGNCIRIKGSYVIVENLYFHNASAFVEGNYHSDGGWLEWEMGAIYIDKGAEHCVIRKNEIYDCPAAIRSYGQYALITENYIHDCNRPLRRWNWGPLGIWLGGDYQTVSHNTIINMQVNDPDRSHFANGVGGGAIEIDDGRFLKSHIILSYNFTQDNCGFLETVFNDVVANPEYKDWQICFNVSDDYQAFVKLRFAKNCSVDNNTIIRRKINATELGVFVFKGNNTVNKVRNNIIVTGDNVKVFNLVGKAKPGTFISNNLYYPLQTLVMGDEGPGLMPVFNNPLFINIDGTKATDYVILPSSPAKDKAMDLGYHSDFIGGKVPFGSSPDIGAFEFNPSYNSIIKTNNLIQ